MNLNEYLKHDNNLHDLNDEETRNNIKTLIKKFYKLNKRQLPWRNDLRILPNNKNKINNNDNNNNNNNNFDNDEINYFTPYGTWISEIMCQQTRIDTVIPYYIKWMNKFKNIFILANSNIDEINTYWAGLGYYSRARNLHNGAKYIVENHNGIIPNTREELLKVPGIGEYTAGAILSIAFNQREALVDGNVYRIVSRLRGVYNEIKSKDMKLFTWNFCKNLLIDENESNILNQSLMELGATICLPNGQPLCDQCPLNNHCITNQLNQEVKNFDNKNNNNDNNKSINNYFKSVDPKKNIESKEDNNDDIIDIEDLTKNENELNNNIKCDLCKYQDQSNDNIIQILTNISNFPKPKQKKKPVPQIVLVCVLKNISNNNFFMSKRPDNGLLAGQWEFPSMILKEWNEKKEICPLNNNKNNELNIINGLFPKDIRINKIHEYLLDKYNIKLNNNYNITKQETLPIIKHIFSHRLHYMIIEYFEIENKIISIDDNNNIDEYKKNDNNNINKNENIENEIDEKKEITNNEEKDDNIIIRWANSNIIKNKGITTGMKKVLLSIINPKKINNNNNKKKRKTNNNNNIKNNNKKKKISDFFN